MNNSTTARANILDRLRGGAPGQTPPSSDFSVLAEKQWDLEEKIRRYREVTEAVNTQVFDTTEADWIDTLRNLLTQRGVKDLFFGPATWAADKLNTDWDNGADNLPELVCYDRPIEDIKADLFASGAGLTTSLGAIAETGSLILWPTPNEPRLLSLVPPIHVVLLNEDNFYNTFWEALTVNQWRDNLPTNALLISGPSKTADIEQELCYGVHGPKELLVMLIRK